MMLYSLVTPSRYTRKQVHKCKQQDSVAMTLVIHKPQQSSAADGHLDYSDENYAFGVYTLYCLFESAQDLTAIVFVFHRNCLFACIPDILLYQKALFQMRALLEHPFEHEPESLWHIQRISKDHPQACHESHEYHEEFTPPTLTLRSQDTTQFPLTLPQG